MEDLLIDFSTNSYVLINLDRVIMKFYYQFRRYFYHRIVIKGYHPLDISEETYFNSARVYKLVNSLLLEDPANFWSSIPKDKNTSFYFNRLKKHIDKVLIISELKTDSESEKIYKTQWVNEHLNFSVDKIVFTNDVSTYSIIEGNVNILVDSLLSKVNSFNKNGGIGVWDLGKRAVASHQIETVILPFLSENAIL